MDCVDHVEVISQQPEVKGNDPVISSHVLWGTDDCQIMKLLGRIKKQFLVMLVDSRSTHNFIDQTVVKRLMCSTQLMPVVNVIVANGEILKVQEVCKVLSWYCQGLN